ncbi:MAG TPA: MarR family transcriptional regulator [Pseudonocardia sp.]|nr:MarR family transcriptional regulator [Pseudonocardia sp.]
MPDEIETRERRRWDAAEPTWALWEVMRSATEAGHVLAERMGLPYNDVRALEVLTDSEAALGPVELGHRLGMRSASATELVDRLEAGGHVRRVRHPRDRRRVVVEVTEEGRSAVLSELGPLLARFDRVAGALDAPGRGRGRGVPARDRGGAAGLSRRRGLIVVSVVVGAGQRATRPTSTPARSTPSGFHARPSLTTSTSRAAKPVGSGWVGRRAPSVAGSSR